MDRIGLPIAYNFNLIKVGEDAIMSTNTTTRPLNDTIINIITGSRITRVRVSDIEVVEQEGRKLHIMTANEDYPCYAHIDSIKDQLLEEIGFFQPMKKIIINFSRIKEIADGEIIFMSGSSLCMGRNAFTDTRRAFKEYIMSYSGMMKTGSGIHFSESKKRDKYDK